MSYVSTVCLDLSLDKFEKKHTVICDKDGDEEAEDSDYNESPSYFYRDDLAANDRVLPELVEYHYQIRDFEQYKNLDMNLHSCPLSTASLDTGSVSQQIDESAMTMDLMPSPCLAKPLLTMPIDRSYVSHTADTLVNWDLRTETESDGYPCKYKQVEQQMRYAIESIERDSSEDQLFRVNNETTSLPRESRKQRAHATLPTSADEITVIDDDTISIDINSFLWRIDLNNIYSCRFVFNIR
jgi:hypothetical protein